MRFLLPKAVLELHRLCSKDGDISRIQVTKDRAVATNGHQLIRILHSVESMGDTNVIGVTPTERRFIDNDLDLFIPRGVAKSILKGSKASTEFSFEFGGVAGYPDQACATIYRLDGDFETFVQYKWDTNTFPDITPFTGLSDVGSCYNFGFSLEILNVFYGYLKAIKAGSGAEFTIWPSIKDQLSPIHARLTNQTRPDLPVDDILWVGMPIRM